MSKTKDRINSAFEILTGGLPGDDILPRLKELMIQETFFTTLFGDEGKRIDVDGGLSISPESLPVLELRLISETFPTRNSYRTGVVEGRILLNNSFKSNYNKKRRLALIFDRYFSSDKYHAIFDMVPGLIELGKNLRADYALMYRVGSIAVPGIKLRFDFKLDPYLWRKENKNIDWDEPLDGDEFSVTDSELQLLVEDTDELLTTQEIYNPEDE